MSLAREGIVVKTVTLAADTEKGIFVDRAGAVVESGAAFGVTMDKGSAGHAVPVCRLGFCAIRMGFAAESGENGKVKTTTGGKGLLTTTGGNIYNAVLQAACPENGALVGAWVNCVDQMTI